MPKPLKKTRELQNLIKWLKEKTVMTIYNFSEMHKSKYYISNEGKYIKEAKDNIIKVYCKRIERYSRDKYIKTQEEITVAWRNVIGYMHENRRMTVESVFLLQEDLSNIEYYNKLLVIIKDSIIQQKALTTSDTSMKGGRIGGYWLITNDKKQETIQNTLFNKRQNNNTIKGVDVIIILELVTVLYKRSRNVVSGKITIKIDNLKVYKGLVDEIYKASYYS